MDESLSPAEASAETRKWACEYCTYQNFQNSLHCIMCKGKKPELDIFRLSPSTQYPLKDNLISPSGQCTSSSVDNGWECGACTFQNSARAEQCGQCLAKAPSTAKLQEQVKALSIRGDSNPDLASNVNNRGSPFGSCTNLAKAGAARFSPVESKWACSTCTYENWPRSIRCAMCQTPVSIMKLPQPSSRLNSPKQASNERLNLATTSPERVQNASAQINYDDCAAGLATSNNNKRNNMQNLRYQLVNSPSGGAGGAEAVSDVQQERRVRQMNRRQADWHWLNACIGVVDNK
jgi:ubiquitin thioesterase ZRANB1